jgi:hypothetical protein
MIRTIAAAAVFALLTNTAYAKAETETRTGNYIIAGCNEFAKGTWTAHNCQDVATEIKGWECLGAVHAVADEAAIHHEICVHQEVTNRQLLTVVSKYMGDNPDKLHWPYAALIFNALQTAWPCPEQ